MKKITQKLTKSFWRISFLATAFLFSFSINAQDLALQGIIDFDIPSAGNDGKAIHVLALNNIDDLSLYGIGVANNGGGTDGQEYTFPAVSASAGDNILVARSPSNIALYLAANEVNIILANSSIEQNGDDAIELFYNGEVIETFGDINNDGTDQSWEYLDSWAYKENGVWTYGGVACTVDSETSAESSCPYPYTGVYVNNVETFDVTFSVNTANITVEENGIFLGGGVLGGSDEYAMSDDDQDGTWTVTISLNEGTQGNYTFFNGPTSSSDWGSGENLAGQECADPDNYNDRILQPITADTTLLHCFNSCDTDGTCPSTFYDVTLKVNTANIEVGEGGIFLGGGVIGGANEVAMADDNNDGTWEVTVSLLEGTTGNYAFFNSPSSGGDWDTKENLAGQDCADEVNFYDRILAPITENTTLLHCFGSCGTDGTGPSVFYDVTFSVNTAGIEVVENGIFLGGGALGGSDEYAMSDDDGDGTWTVTISLLEGTQGNYTFFNGPTSSSDWGSGENLAGQECADPDNYNDRILQPITADTTLLHCFNSCETDGTCSSPTAVTFNVDMSQYGLADGDTVHVNGEFTGWCGSCGNEMSDADGDGIYTITMDINPGTYFWKFSINAWGDQESFSEDIDGCTAENNGNFDRQIVIGSDDMEVTYGWNSCEAGLSVSDNTLLDMRIYPNPSNGSYVTIQTPVNGVKYVEVFDITGKRLINTSLNADTLNVSSISTGMYFVKVTVAGQSKTSKLIIR
jgi:hypothetical protein